MLELLSTIIFFGIVIGALYVFVSMCVCGFKIFEAVVEKFITPQIKKLSVSVVWINKYGNTALILNLCVSVLIMFLSGYSTMFAYMWLFSLFTLVVFAILIGNASKYMNNKQ